MIKKILTYYKIPLLTSATIGIVILALGIVRNAWGITEVVIGSLFGTFVLEMEYVLYAYILEPKSEFAKTIFGYIKYKDYKSLVSFINEHKNDVKDKSLNSALFQAILAPMSVFVVYSSASLFIKALILSTFANSIYRLIECYFEGSTNNWFWAMRGNPKKEGVLAFIIGLILVLIFCLYMI